MLANAIVGMAESVGRKALRDPNAVVDGDQLAQWISELAWFGLRGVRTDDLARLELAQPHAPDRVVAALFEHEVRATARGRDVLAQVHEVHLLPDRVRELARRFLAVLR